MKKIIRPLVAFTVIALSVAVSSGLWTYPKSQSSDYEGFSSERVKHNFKSCESDSLFYFKNVSGQGGDRIIIDSSGKAGFAYDFPPADSSSSRILLVSRGNGFEPAIQSELMMQALKSRGSWKRGLRVLYVCEGADLTDDVYAPVYDGAGLAIYTYATGVCGPAFLYGSVEGGNAMKLYSKAAYPWFYSFFRSFKDRIPSDSSYEAVSGKVPSMLFTDAGSAGGCLKGAVDGTLQHYGEQMTPVVAEYLASDGYGDLSSIPETAFTVPFAGLFHFKGGQTLLYGSLLLLLFCIAFCFAIIRGRLKPMKALLKAGVVLVCSAAAYATGLIIKAVSGPDLSVISVAAILAAILILTLTIYLLLRKKSAVNASRNSLRSSASSSSTARYTYSLLYGTMIVAVVTAAVSIFTLKECFFIAVPLFFALAGIVLWRVLRLREFLLISVAGILIYSIPFLGTCISVSAGGLLPETLATAFYNMVLLILLTDLYVRRDKAI